MAASDFKWVRYPMSGSQLRSFGIRTFAAAGDLATVELPDLTAFPTPNDKAKVLLHTAAEVEHSLLTQYLYASFSLRDTEGLQPETDPGRLEQLSRWTGLLMNIAQQEMGHLMTVQNLLLLTRLPTSLEREEMPATKDFYPFPLHLEPLTRQSLAKYVVTESPTDAQGIEDIIQLATGGGTLKIHRVGVLYALLGAVFSTAAELDANAARHPWYEIVRDIARVAYQQQPPGAWHLPDDAFDPSSIAQQADKTWARPGAGLNVFQVSDRAGALEALRNISVQGEGPGNEGDDSHFERFRTAFRGGQNPATPPFPADGEWRPSRSVAVDPFIPAAGDPPADNGITHPRAALVAELSNTRYALLLGFIEHHLLSNVPADRLFLRNRAISEMRELSNINSLLAALPQRSDGTGVASTPFTLPRENLHLPVDERSRWGVHRQRMELAIRLIEKDGGNASREKNSLAEINKRLQ